MGVDGDNYAKANRTIKKTHNHLLAGLSVKPNHRAEIIDWQSCYKWSSFVRQNPCSLEDLVKLYRGESDIDPRPNKHLHPIPSDWSEHAGRWNKLVINGLKLSLSREPPWQDRPPKNHPSLRDNLSMVMQSYKQGQLDGKYLILEKDVLPILNHRGPQLKFYPIGAVPKPGYNMSEKIRQINDFSFPEGQSLNDCLDASSFFDEECSKCAGSSPRSPRFY